MGHDANYGIPGFQRRLSAPGLSRPRTARQAVAGHRHSTSVGQWQRDQQEGATEDQAQPLRHHRTTAERRALHSMVRGVQRTLAMVDEEDLALQRFIDHDEQSPSPRLIFRPPPHHSESPQVRIGAAARMRMERLRDDSITPPADDSRMVRQRSCDRIRPSLALPDEGKYLTPCAFLQPGTSFVGSQSFLTSGSLPLKAWNVTVEITEVSGLISIAPDGVKRSDGHVQGY